MDLWRIIYQDLLKWKEEASGKVLEVNGARQVGKTYILDKFARENYKTYIYINMVQSSGKAFLECLNSIQNEWKPRTKREENPIHKAINLFDDQFEDCKDTIVVIDEIQESPEVFSMIRELARGFEADFIVTGSYLGKTFNKKYFLPAGDIDVLILDTLSFEEFLMAVGKREIYQGTDLFDISSHDKYGELKNWYDIYCQIGGYPAVVKKYIEKKNIVACKKEIVKIIKNFIGEFECYKGEILEVNLLEQRLLDVTQSMIKEKKISNDQAMKWLCDSDIIGYTGKKKQTDSLNTASNGKFFFRDIGVCRHFLEVVGASPDVIAGILDENFRYISLKI